MKKLNIVLLLLAILGGVNAQDWKEKYKAADNFYNTYNDGYYYGNVNPKWIDNSHSFWYSVKTPNGTEYFIVDADKKVKKHAFDHSGLAKVLSTELNREVEPYKLPFRDITFMDGQRSMSFTVDATTYTYDIMKKKITNRSKDEGRNNWRGHWGKVDEENRKESVFSPDGKKEAYVSEGNLFIKDTESGKVKQLTYDGSTGEYYSSRIVWSPDSKKLVTSKYRPAWIRKLRTVVSSPKNQLQPEMEEIDYIKPGDALPIRKPVLFLADEGKQVNIDFEDPESQFNVGNIRWSKGSDYFTFDYNKRGHQEYIIYKVSGENPKAQPLVYEKMPTFVFYTNIYRYDIEDKHELLWISERDGWRHLYLYDINSGNVKRQLTKGNWVVKRVVHVDESKREAYIVACGRDINEDPYLEKLYRLNIDNGDITALSPENGNHKITFSADYKYFIDTWSRADLPPVAVLKDTKTGNTVLELEKADVSKAIAKGWAMPEVFSAKGRDGVTDIWGVIVRPANYDPNKKYPVIENIYAGPHDSHVPKNFSIGLVDAALTELDFIVVSIDGMGTANRSKEFHDVCWKNLKDAGFPDRIAWMKAAAEKYPEMDVDRVGIYGCSAGGQNAMGAVLFHPDFYKVSVAACGCHDNRMDKIWWNEQWMGYPIGKEYEESSNVVNAHLLEGNLMLILGELDDNVDPSSTVQVVDALITANKDFEYVLLPNQRHTMGGAYGERKRRDFFVKHLHGENSPNWNK